MDAKRGQDVIDEQRQDGRSINALTRAKVDDKLVMDTNDIDVVSPSCAVVAENEGSKCEPVERRFELLDSLMKRKRKIYSGTGYVESHGVEDFSLGNLNLQPSCLRSKNRILLEKSFLKGMEMAGLTGPYNGDPSIFSALLACELELEIMKKCEGNTTEYKDKMRSLRYNLEDKKNPTLCVRVILGLIDTKSLVSMSVEELASQKKLEERARAEELSLKNVVLTTSETENVKIQGQAISVKGIGSSFSSDTLKRQLKATPNSRKLPRLLSDAGNTSRSNVSAALIESTDKTKDLEQTATFTDQGKTPSSTIKTSSSMIVGEQPSINDEARTEARNEELSTNVSPKKSSFVSLGKKKNTAATSEAQSAPPPYNGKQAFVDTSFLQLEHNLKLTAPPSPTHSIVSNAASISGFSTARSTTGVSISSSAQGSAVKNSSNGEIWYHFIFTKYHKCDIEAYITHDIDCIYSLDGFLPLKLLQKGATPIEKFDEFVLDKQRRSWKVISLRLGLSNTTPENQREYKRFYKAHEQQKKIACFEVGNDTQIFVVTPKYTRAKCLKDLIVKFDKSHVVVVTKRELRQTVSQINSSSKRRVSDHCKTSKSAITRPWGVPQAPSHVINPRGICFSRTRQKEFSSEPQMNRVQETSRSSSSINQNNTNHGWRRSASSSVWNVTRK